jgi:hypothetical protein
VSAVNLAFAGVLSHHIADDKTDFNGHRLGFLKTPLLAKVAKNCVAELSCDPKSHLRQQSQIKDHDWD